MSEHTKPILEETLRILGGGKDPDRWIRFAWACEVKLTDGSNAGERDCAIYSPTATCFCVTGAVALAVARVIGNPKEARGAQYAEDTKACEAIVQAVDVLRDRRRADPFAEAESLIARWNDAPGRTYQDVVQALEKAIGAL